MFLWLCTSKYNEWYNYKVDKDVLTAKYASGASMKQIASELNCSVHKISYWMQKYGIKRRNISDAVYIKHNPNGDPFHIKNITSINEALLMGMGLGLFWGEGNKADKYSVRLGNTNPVLIKTYIKFLTGICGVKKEKMKFSLQIFSDINKSDALEFWMSELDVSPSQFYKVTVTISGAIGTYRAKTKHGVLQVYVHNKKLRDALINMLPT